MQKPFFHHYHLTQLLNQQKLKSTYLAYPQGDMKLKVVVKIFDSECMLPDHDYAQSLTAMKGFLALDHHHIVPVLNMGIENRQPYIVTRYMSHGSLRQRLDSWSSRRMHWTTAVNIAIQIAQALMYAHERHIIHGNIKPNNIFFDAEEEVLLTDFRPSHFIDISKLSYKTDLQTTSYMAPEQFMGKGAPSSDQYALACLTYELLTGHTPFFDAQNFSLLWQKHATALPSPLTIQVPELPGAIESAILKAMSKNSQTRYPDIAMFAHALESELPASAIRKGKTTLPSELEREFPRSFSLPPQKEIHTIQISALTSSLPIFEDTYIVKKPAFTAPASAAISVTQDTVSEEKLTASISTALVAKKKIHSDIKDTKTPTLALSSLLGQSTRVTHYIQQKQLAMISAFLAQWKNQRFKPSKRFVIWTCALVIMIILSIGQFIFNNLSVNTHEPSVRSGGNLHVPHTKQAIVGVLATPTLNVTASIPATSVTAGATSTPRTTPGGSGGDSNNGGGSVNGGSSGNTGTLPTMTNTVAPVTSLNRAQHASVNASSSFEGGGWGIAHINDDITASTPSSMGWSSDGDFVINHTEWISFDFGSNVLVGRVDLFPRSDAGNVGQGFPIDFSIMLSFDDSTWRSVVDQSNYPMPGSTENQVFFFKAQSTRYLMIQATTLRQIPSEYNRYRMQFSEICIY